MGGAGERRLPGNETSVASASPRHCALDRREARMSRIRGPFYSAVAVVLLTACGSNSTTSTVATSTARGTLIQDPPLRIASLDAAAFTAQLNATTSGQGLLELAGTPTCGVDF